MTQNYLSVGFRLCDFHCLRGDMSLERKEPNVKTNGFSFVHNDQFYLSDFPRYFRVGDRQPYREFQLEFPLQRFDFTLAQWSDVSVVIVDFEPKESRLWTEFWLHDDCSVCCAVLGNSVYLFGGLWKYGYAVHELNLEEMVWRRLEPQNREDGPMIKKWAGMVAYGDEALCIFGGYGGSMHGRRQPGATYLWIPVGCTSSGCLSNELHLFHIKTGTWSSPETTGLRPSPCVGFSFTKVDSYRVVVFGGQQGKGPESYVLLNEVHILDMNNWHWNGAILPSSPSDLWPRGRYKHSACVLFTSTPISSEGSSKETTHTSSPDMSLGQHKPQLLILWGLDKIYTSVDGDAWILDVNSITWKPVKLPPVVDQPRYRFFLGHHDRSPTEAELVVFGGYKCANGIYGQGTTLLHLGMKTLYHSCVDYIAERYELYQPLLQQLLPPRIQTDICRERDKRTHYTVAQL